MILRSLRRRPSGWFILAAALAIVAALVTMRAAARTPTATILVAQDVIPAGTPVSRAGITTRAVPAPAATLPGLIRQADSIALRRFAVTVSPGEPITEASLGGDPRLAPRPLAPGERAVSIPAAAAGAALPALIPGARVDVTAPTSAGSAAVVVRDGEVIGRQEGDPEGDSASEGGVLLRVNEKDAMALSTAVDTAAGIRILIRPWDDGETPTPTPTSP